MTAAAPVAIATCREAFDRSLDEDEPLLVQALDALGIPAVPQVWDDPTVDWSAHQLVVIRSTWDYPERLGPFLDWADHVANVAALRNPPAILRWNTDKRYLRDLSLQSVPVVPTTFLAPGQPVQLPPADGDLVVKPAVSAGSRDTARHGREQREAAHAHAQALLAAGRVAMVQPYQDGVDQQGETALVFIGGVFSHAMRKGPILEAGARPVDGLYAAEQMTLRDPSEAERSAAAAVLSAIPGGTDLLYARIDLVPDQDGAPLVLEVELTEPSLFLTHVPAAAAALADAISGTLAAGRLLY